MTAETTTVDVPLRWLDDAAPDLAAGGVTCGVPLPAGAVRDAGDLAVHDGDGAPVPAQTWPLALWPDGSVKWAGVALGNGEPAEGYRVVRGPAAAAAVRVTVTAVDGGYAVDTGAGTTVVADSGPEFIRSMRVGGNEVATGGRLVSSRQDHPEPDVHGRVHATGHVTGCAVEQDGPLRAVLRVEGVHRDDTGRAWLPFTVRLVFAAGAPTFKLVHSFVFDGDPERDFLSSLGVEFTVPLRAAWQDRHVRIAGAEGGFLREAVRGLTGMRRDPGAAVREAQMDGRATPPADTWERGVGDLSRWIPAWDDYSLRQLSANGYTLHKRTAPDRPWIDVAQGTRADGLAYVGDTGGGLAVGLNGFWQSHPTGIDVRGAAGDAATLATWLWSPESAPMDLRFYHDGLGQETYADQLDALEITYEDYEPGFGTAHGIGRTHELTVTPFAATPPVEELARITRATVTRPQLTPTPEALQGMLGDWDLPDRTDPHRAALEDRVSFLLDFYVGQVEQRSWYGFWNYGDVMHAYDTDRHTWRYDVGGYAWDNSELSPDLWLWTSFLRTGRADVYRLAERMTRHTGDVDVYHAGPWQGLGTRHNVQHWGCSAKQLRISTPAYRRPHYFLTGDEHTRDLMLELRDSDTTFLAVDPTRKVRRDAATYRPERRALAVGLGTDWSALAATWLADWELTGNERSRDRLLGTMRDIGALPKGFFTGEALYDLDTGRFDTDRDRVSVSHLSAVFGLVEVCSELVGLIDAGQLEAPGFKEAWLQYCRLYLATPEQQTAELGAPLSGIHLEQAHSRLAAYAANRLGDDALADLAWDAYYSGGEFMGEAAFIAVRVLPPEVLAPVEEARTLWTNDAAQCSLATIQNLALIGHRLKGPQA
ncbi:Tat pathway signal sequence domain protein [Glycomyces paridis]|uniref:Tat pathway signal sequence domain protein n=1 Tax=Glycomyces paridis TaxID=2126555 RepID=A0A4S8PMF0_9ACTN|nr:Tat pathway signal sequence domain protein [Glycomyces paridis]THV29474.1 Tat pathway signal sequence domain protein [Glycomyces paridis]